MAGADGQPTGVAAGGRGRAPAGRAGPRPDGLLVQAGPARPGGPSGARRDATGRRAGDRASLLADAGRQHRGSGRGTSSPRPGRSRRHGGATAQAGCARGAGARRRCGRAPSGPGLPGPAAGGHRHRRAHRQRAGAAAQVASLPLAEGGSPSAVTAETSASEPPASIDPSASTKLVPGMAASSTVLSAFPPARAPPGAGSRAGAVPAGPATARPAGTLSAGLAGGSRLSLSFAAESAGAASPPPKALATERSADVTSLGMTQNVFPAPCARFGSGCRYW